MPILGDNTMNLRTSIIEEVREQQQPVLEAAAKAEQLNTRMEAVEQETAQVVVTTEVLAALRFDPQGQYYGAVRSEDEPTVATWDESQALANNTAIQQAADDAKLTGGTLVLKGRYMVSGALQFECHVDASDAELYVNQSDIRAVLVGSRTPGTVLRRRNVRLPAVRQLDKVPDGGWDASGIGVEVCNAHTCSITIPHSRWFGEGVRVSAYGTGCVYNTFYLGHMDNNRIGMRLIPRDTSAWVNENVFMGGVWSMNSGEGINIPGTRHILISPPPAGSTWRPDNNLFVKPSIEGNGPEFHYECYGQDNRMLQARWEASLGSKAQFNGSMAARNTIDDGYGAGSVTVTQVNGAVNNKKMDWLGIRHYTHATLDVGALYGRSAVRIHGSTNVFASTGSSTDHVIAILTNGSTHDTNAATDWRLGISTAYFETKNTPDTHARFRLTLANGAMAWGPGSGAQDTTLARSAANTLTTGDDDSLRIGDGMWNGGHLIMGPVHIWLDSSGNLRKKAGAPTSETDGTVVG